MSEVPSLTGRLLVAMPGIGDPRFEHAVILICAHGPDHAMGLRLDRPAPGVDLKTVLDKLDAPAPDQSIGRAVLMGGPVERERGFVLHTDDYTAGEHSLHVGCGVALTATREVLEAIAGHGDPPRRSTLALGYAGWGPGQLERELRENVWLTCEPDETLIFGTDHAHKWSNALAKIGVDASLLTSTAGRA